MPSRSNAARTASGVSPCGTLNLIVPLLRSIAVSTPYGGLRSGSPSRPAVKPPRPPRPPPPKAGGAPVAGGVPAAAPPGTAAPGASAPVEGPRPAPGAPRPNPPLPRPPSPRALGGGSASQIGIRFFACASLLTVAKYVSLSDSVVTD